MRWFDIPADSLNDDYCKCWFNRFLPFSSSISPHKHTPKECIESVVFFFVFSKAIKISRSINTILITVLQAQTHTHSAEMWPAIWTLEVLIRWGDQCQSAFCVRVLLHVWKPVKMIAVIYATTGIPIDFLCFVLSIFIARLLFFTLSIGRSLHEMHIMCSNVNDVLLDSTNIKLFTYCPKKELTAHCSPKKIS